MSHHLFIFREQGPHAALAEREVQDPVEYQEEKDVRPTHAEVEGPTASPIIRRPNRVLLPDVQGEHRQAGQKCRRVGQEENGKRNARLIDLNLRKSDSDSHPGD